MNRKMLIVLLVFQSAALDAAGRDTRISSDTPLPASQNGNFAQSASQNGNFTQSASQNGYFPPADNAQWATLSPEELGWDTARLDQLLDWLGDQQTNAFIILKDGKLVVERYYGFFGRESQWYWASAGKTVTALLIGALEKQGLLDIRNPTSDYLGRGWTSLTEAQEQLITPWHQLTMTTGLDYTIENQDCTLPECLHYRRDAGEQWYYHNAPYTLLTHVAEAAADTSLNAIVEDVFRQVPGLQLRYAEGLSSPFNRVVVSRALDMARFGLLISRETAWEDNESLLDSTFYSAMLTPSQEINPSYGYLWWLNGQESFIPPQLSFSFNRPLTPEAPADMVSALGLNTQVLSIVPSRNLVIVRMGRDPGTLFEFISTKWELLAEVIGTPTPTSSSSGSGSSGSGSGSSGSGPGTSGSGSESSSTGPGSSGSCSETPNGFRLMQNYPNPFNPSTHITFQVPLAGPVRLDVFDPSGRLIATLADGFRQTGTHRVRFDADGLGSGLYLYRLRTPDGTLTRKMILLQ